MSKALLRLNGTGFCLCLRRQSLGSGRLQIRRFQPAFAAFRCQLRSRKLPQPRKHDGHRGHRTQTKHGLPRALVRPPLLVEEKPALVVRFYLLAHRLETLSHLHHRGRSLQRVDVQASVDPFPETLLHGILSLIWPRRIKAGLQILRDLFLIRLEPLASGHALRRSDVAERVVTPAKLARQQAEGEHAERIHIPPVAGFLQVAGRVLELLGWLIKQRIGEMKQMHPRHIAERPVGQQHLAIVVDQDIAGLQIAVGHAPPVHFRKHPDERFHDPP